MAAVTPICVKATFAEGPKSEEERNCDFFQRPIRGFEERQYDRSLLEKKIDGVHHLTAGILAKVTAGEAVRTKMEFLDPIVPHCYSPSLRFVEALAEKYRRKYGIDIAIVPLADAASHITAIAARNETVVQGLILYQEDTFHITPVLISRRKPDAPCIICVMDCVDSTNLFRETGMLRNLLVDLPPDSIVVASRGVRMADGYSCRLEGMTLLKYCSLWLERKGADFDLLSFLDTKVETIDEMGIRIFRVPEIWALGAQFNSSLRKAAVHREELINRKEETFSDWRKRHQYTATIKVTITDKEGGNCCENVYVTPMNLFLLFQSMRYVKQL
jgi:hypothetical protein